MWCGRKEAAGSTDSQGSLHAGWGRSSVQSCVCQTRDESVSSLIEAPAEQTGKSHAQISCALGIWNVLHSTEPRAAG